MRATTSTRNWRTRPRSRRETSLRLTRATRATSDWRQPRLILSARQTLANLATSTPRSVVRRAYRRLILDV
jgi:hypothetical protein